MDVEISALQNKPFEKNSPIKREKDKKDLAEKKFNCSRKNPWGSRSYADLITEAIENSPERRLTLAEIYDYMVKNVPHFSDKADNNSSAGWKNSIRHNLSLHTRFVRMQNEGTGKSSWWVIDPNAGEGRATRRRPPGDRQRTRRLRNTKSKSQQRSKAFENLKNVAYPFKTAPVQDKTGSLRTFFDKSNFYHEPSPLPGSTFDGQRLCSHSSSDASPEVLRASSIQQLETTTTEQQKIISCHPYTAAASRLCVNGILGCPRESHVLDSISPLACSLEEQEKNLHFTLTHHDAVQCEPVNFMGSMGRYNFDLKHSETHDDNITDFCPEISVLKCLSSGSVTTSVEYPSSYTPRSSPEYDNGLGWIEPTSLSLLAPEHGLYETRNKADYFIGESFHASPKYNRTELDNHELHEANGLGIVYLPVKNANNLICGGDTTPPSSPTEPVQLFLNSLQYTTAQSDDQSNTENSLPTDLQNCELSCAIECDVDEVIKLELETDGSLGFEELD